MKGLDSSRRGRGEDGERRRRQQDRREQGPSGAGDHARPTLSRKVRITPVNTSTSVRKPSCPLVGSSDGVHAGTSPALMPGGFGL